MFNNNRLVSVLNSYNEKIPPIWLMRQAGRYLPEYLELRSKTKNFLDFCYNPELAAKVTLQPIERFDFDAAIIFSDILVLPDALGANVNFHENIGPIIDPIVLEDDIKNFGASINREKLSKVYEAIKITRSNLKKDKALIGFAGSPFTVSCYLVEGKSSKDYASVKKFALTNKGLYDQIIEKLIVNTADHLIKQIESGVNVIMLFDSWAGVLDEEMCHRYVIEPTRRVVELVRAAYPNIPIIGFPKGANRHYKAYIEKTKVTAVSCDYTYTLSDIKNDLLGKIPLQGNLDPVYLFASKDILQKKLEEILNVTKDYPFIFNLGHGILPKTPIENVEFMVNFIRNYNI